MSYIKVSAMSDLEAAVSQSRDIFELYQKEALRIRDDNWTQDASDFNADSLIMHYLLGSMQLAGQTFSSYAQGMTYLALIGTRSLLEREIDLRYMLTVEGVNIDSIAEEFLNESNSDYAMKQKINNASIGGRISKLDNKDVVSVIYGRLCNYSHGRAQVTTLNNDDEFKCMTQKGLCYTLQFFHNIVQYCGKYFEKGYDRSGYDIVNFCSRFAPELCIEEKAVV